MHKAMMCKVRLQDVDSRDETRAAVYSCCVDLGIDLGRIMSEADKRDVPSPCATLRLRIGSSSSLELTLRDDGPNLEVAVLDRAESQVHKAVWCEGSY